MPPTTKDATTTTNPRPTASSQDQPLAGARSRRKYLCGAARGDDGDVCRSDRDVDGGRDGFTGTRGAARPGVDGVQMTYYNQSRSAACRRDAAHRRPVQSRVNAGGAASQLDRRRDADVLVALRDFGRRRARAVRC